MALRVRSVVFAAFCVFASASADPAATATALRDKALTDNTAWDFLQSLTSEIGPRPVGSPAAVRARDWAVEKLKSLGFTDIKVEPFAKPSWQRGTESAEIISPVPQKLAIIGLGDSLPTPKKGIEAPVVVLKSYAALLAAPEGAFKGKIVLVNQPMTRTQDGSGYGAAVVARNGNSEAAKRGALAYLTRSISTGSGRAPHTGATWGDGPHVPTAALGVPDADLLETLAAKGEVRIRLKLANRLDPKSLAWNISGEIKGSEKPDEVIVIGGHIDSWDPGTGAIDDGAGMAITAAAAKLIGDLPRHPRRTIRVVFWGSEENGGSEKAYGEAHKSEGNKLILAGESDLGADNVYKVALPKPVPGLAEKLTEILAPLHVIVDREPARHGGADIEGLQENGVPILSVSNDATRYFDYHHSADDTLAIVDPVQLRQNVAVWASLIYLLADSDIDFRTPAAKQ